jgi:hypothetical protein
MTECPCCSELRHQINMLLANKPFDLDEWHDGQYSGLRTIIRLMDKIHEEVGCKTAT